MADINHLGDYTVMDTLSTLESLIEWACNYTEEKPFTGIKGSSHYLMATVNRKAMKQDHFPIILMWRPYFCTHGCCYRTTKESD